MTACQKSKHRRILNHYEQDSIVPERKDPKHYTNFILEEKIEEPIEEAKHD